MDKEELKQRTKQFGLRVINLVNALPNTIAGRAIGNQVVRCGTSVGANYRAACRGRSTAEFIAKIGTVEEEADESAWRLEIVIEGELLPRTMVEALLKEAEELTAIFTAIGRTSKRNRANCKSGVPNPKSGIPNPKSEI